jgi:hypothetical protein
MHKASCLAIHVFRHGTALKSESLWRQTQQLNLQLVAPPVGEFPFNNLTLLIESLDCQAGLQ